jgi:hypothetical protein
MRFSGQVRHDLQELVIHACILGAISVGGHSFRHFFCGVAADDNDGYLREASAHNLQKLNP